MNIEREDGMSPKESVIKALKTLLARVEGGEYVIRCDCALSLGEPMVMSLTHTEYSHVMRLEIEFRKHESTQGAE